MKGPGSYLRQLFSGFYLDARPDCPCHEHAEQMDRWTPDENEEHFETIIGWIRDEARERKLTFGEKEEIAVRHLVRVCIWAARRQRWPLPYRLWMNP